MGIKLKFKHYRGMKIHYRPGSNGQRSSDENVLQEVLISRGYRKAKLMFDVLEREHWLDLGANIGSFALYCKWRGATCESYEPDPTCYKILCMNVPDEDDGAGGNKYVKHNAAVSVEPTGKLRLWNGADHLTYSRGTLLRQGRKMQDSVLVDNVHVAKLATNQYDGIKMDIEGSEFGILDARLLPRARKLVLEYHTSREDDMAALRSRMAYLKSLYEVVSYPKELDKMMAKGDRQESFFDRLIFCKGLRA